MNTKLARPQQDPPFGAPGSESFRRMGALLATLREEIADVPAAVVAEEVAALSHALTRRRGSTVRSEYLAAPSARRAYLAHFLPWNVYRLLLAWELSWPMDRCDAQRAVVEDWGAGPLTALLAAWVREGDELGGTWRCFDREGAMLGLGMRIARRLGIAGRVQIELVTGDAIQERNAQPGAKADLIVLANVLNEWLPARGRSPQNMQTLSERVSAALHEGGQVFVMEPANRVVSHGVMTLRGEMLRAGFVAHAPCTHQGRCPLLDPRLHAWCHFRMPLTVHPEHQGLLRLTGIARNEISFSFLHLERGVGQSGGHERRAVVMSDAMATGKNQQSIYACAPEGRVVLSLRQTLPLQGSNVAYRLERPFRRDPRGGWRGKITGAHPHT